ncbi:MAG: elongation factor G [Acidobacteria bacterium]|nr:elongation factor G [Acidobacteriota bacterium]MDW7984269.1 elongation factor G [Acidobacteriota bacterium]
MNGYTTDRIRNVAVVGHGATGKTSVVSCLLYTAGATERLGRVDEGHAVTDFTDEEIEHRRSFYTALAYLEWKKTKVNLLDTPGYGPFIFEAKGALHVADAALIVVDATVGPEVITEKVWEFARSFGVPRAIVLNKMDRERADFGRVLELTQKVFGREVVPVQVPIGQEASFQGVVDLITRTAYVYEPRGLGRPQTRPVPEDLQETVDSYREKLIELVAENDEALMNQYFETGDLKSEDFLRGLRTAFAQGVIVPVFCVSAELNVGLVNLLDAIVAWFPDPSQRGAVEALDANGRTVSVAVRSSDPTALFVFKTISDPYMGRINVAKVYAGTLRPDTTLAHTVRGHEEKIGALQVMMGKQLKTVPELSAGDFVALTKLKDTRTGDTLCDPTRRIRFRPVDYGKPTVFYAVSPKGKADEDKLSVALQRLQDEDPMLHIERDPQTKELIISGSGQLHIQVAIERLRRKFGVEVELHQPKIPYRETIKGTAEAEGRYVKQSGGRGQYGVCFIRIEPLPRGADFEFQETIFGGAIPKQYIPAVEKGIQEARQHGVLAGYPAVDFKVTLFDGKYHEVDSSDLAFKIAGSIAFKHAMEKANPVLLEPIMKVSVYTPEEHLGDVMGDLNGRRARILGIDRAGSLQVVQAYVPMAELINYAAAVTSLTGGRGSFEMEFSHYDEVPPHIAQRVVEEARRRQAAAGEST